MCKSACKGKNTCSKPCGKAKPNLVKNDDGMVVFEITKGGTPASEFSGGVRRAAELLCRQERIAHAIENGTGR